MNTILERVFRLITSWKSQQEHQNNHNHHHHHHHHLQHRHLVESIYQEHSAAANANAAAVEHRNSSHFSSPTNRSDELIEFTPLSLNRAATTTQPSATSADGHFYYAIGSETPPQTTTTAATTRSDSSSDPRMPAEANIQPQQQLVQLQPQQEQFAAEMQQQVEQQQQPSVNVLRFNFGINRRRVRSRNRSSLNHSTRSNNNNLVSNGLASRLASATLSSTSSTTSTSTTSSSSSATNFDLFSQIKKRERNLLAACCSIFCIAVLGVSLIETRWFYLNGGGCNLNYIGVAHFFAPGRLEYQLEYSKVTKNEILVYNFILPNGLGEFF
jgi:hypothetical protein